ncbi:MAG: murein transglycosylase [Planctomycetes bacterium]|nr:murein transglycosylase [Planctomycetota bacterium]
MKYRLTITIALIFTVILTGCRKEIEKEPALNYERQLPPGQLALRLITDPARMPDFHYACYDTKNLQSSILHSLSYLSKPSSKQFFPYGDITHAHAVASLDAFAEMLESQLSGKRLKNAIHRRFDVYESVGCDNKGTVLFTGYYTPIFDGSLEKTARFKYPLYSLPKDLVKGPYGEILGQRQPDGGLTPYPTRFVIESSQMLKGKELAYLADPFEVYIAHVQGSAIIRTTAGEMINIGYAGTNGHEYKSVSKAMLVDKSLPGGKMSLAAMIAYFKANPHKVTAYVDKNPRFVFFQLSDTSPHGSINTPVTAYRSIATDKSVYPRACLSFISTRLPRLSGGNVTQGQYTGFTLDQDTGGAIRAPGRCDVYMGIGDDAGRLAGSIYQEGRLYYLFLKKGR